MHYLYNQIHTPIYIYIYRKREREREREREWKSNIAHPKAKYGLTHSSLVYNCLQKVKSRKTP